MAEVKGKSTQYPKQRFSNRWSQTAETTIPPMLQSAAMPQKHRYQRGTFHITTATKGRMPTCTESDIPKRLIRHLCETRAMQDAQLYAFCILPDHIHILVSPGEKGLSGFMHAFKKNSSRDVPKLQWQKGYFDELIRSDKQRGNVIRYIQGNAMKHQLVKEILDWPWTSLYFDGVLDPTDIWL